VAKPSHLTDLLYALTSFYFLYSSEASLSIGIVG